MAALVERQALVVSEEEFDAEATRRGEEITQRHRQGDEERERKIVEAAEVESTRRRRVEEMEFARLNDSDAGVSKAELKQQIVAESAERKWMDGLMRAESNCQKCDKKLRLSSSARPA